MKFQKCKTCDLYKRWEMKQHIASACLVSEPKTVSPVLRSLLIPIHYTCPAIVNDFRVPVFFCFNTARNCF